MLRNISFVAAILGLASLMIGCVHTPMDAMVIRHTVADYDKWRPAFDADKPYQEAAGLHYVFVARGLQNPNDLEIPFTVDNVDKAKAFAANPRLKDVMQKAGVTGQPDIKFLQVLRISRTAAHGSLGKYVSITAKVNDFDAWLKVFDREGPDARAKDGLTDAVLAHGIDDPNLVYLVFQINSIEQAQAALNNPDRQKLMQESGVVAGSMRTYYGTDK